MPERRVALPSLARDLNGGLKSDVATVEDGEAVGQDDRST